jgi:hypothetical protein
LPPFIGKGVSRDNLIGCIEFVTGACSCTVKEQNPGVDLLIRYDWDSAAAAVAAKFGREEGNENQLAIDEFFPDLILGQGAMPAESGPAGAENKGSLGLSGSIVVLLADAATSKIVDTIKGNGDWRKGWTLDRSSWSWSFDPEALSSLAARTESASPQHDDDKQPEASEKAGTLQDQSQDPVAAADGEEEKDNSETQDPHVAKLAPAHEHVSDSHEVGKTVSATLLLTIGLGVGVALFLLIGATLVMFKPQ